MLDWVPFVFAMWVARPDVTLPSKLDLAMLDMAAATIEGLRPI